MRKHDRDKCRSVSGVYAPPPRPTVLGAAVVAALISLPVGAVLALIDLVVI